jgi:type II secretory pathway predicted ATPase ExeA
MYEQYWGLKEKPFQNTPDPRFFYYSAQHEESLNRLMYAMQEQLGAAMLSGIFGCGKTLVIQTLIKELTQAGNYKVAYISNPQLSHIELLRSIAYHLGVPNLPEKKSEILADFLLEKIEEVLRNNWSDGKSTVLIIDEAHIIEDKTIMESIRLLLNFQLHDRFLLSLLLSGQPELTRNVDNIKQLAQRIAIRCHLEKLSETETNKYITHRLKVAGCEQNRSISGTPNSLFTEQAVHLIFEGSGGIPRRINHISNIALLAAYGKNLPQIDADIIQDVIKETEGIPS